MLHRAVGGTDPLLVRDVESLRDWQRQLRVLTPTRLSGVTFALPELSPEENRSFSVAADSYRKACGCGTGASFMSAAVAGAVVWFFLADRRLSEIALRQVVYLIAIGAVAALSGKLLGLIHARWKLVKLTARALETVITRRSAVDVFTNGRQKHGKSLQGNPRMG